MSEKTLKPCPFCGEKVEIKRKTGSYGYTSDSIYINCCGVRLGEYTEEFQSGRGMYDTTKDATNKLVNEWNTRASDKQIAERDELLREAANHLTHAAGDPNSLYRKEYREMANKIRKAIGERKSTKGGE